MIEVINPGPDPAVVKEVLCHRCGVLLRYLPIDVQSEALYSMNEYSQTIYWINCPKCKTRVDVKNNLPPKKSKPAHAFAIIRLDLPKIMDWDDKVQDYITVRQIVWDEETAKSEVERLNQLNGGISGNSKCIYYSQMTRIAEKPKDN